MSNIIDKWIYRNTIIDNCELIPIQSQPTKYSLGNIITQGTVTVRFIINSINKISIFFNNTSLYDKVWYKNKIYQPAKILYIENYYNETDGTIIKINDNEIPLSYNGDYVCTIHFDYNKKTDDWIEISISNPVNDDKLVDNIIISALKTAYNDNLAEIQILQNSNLKTYIKDFSIVYDDEALKSSGDLVSDDEILRYYIESVSGSMPTYTFDDIIINTTLLSEEDTIYNIILTDCIKIPKYRYGAKNIYESDINCIKDIFNGYNINVYKYPELPEKVANKISDIDLQSMSRDEIVKYLLSVLNDTVELSIAELSSIITNMVSAITEGVNDV